MDGLCLNTRIHGMSSPISGGGALEVRANASQVSKSTVATPPQKTGLSRFSFSFRYPLQSLWPGGGKRSRYNNTMSLDEAVLVDDEETTRRGAAAAVTEEENNNESWVLKILHVRSLQKQEEDVQRESNGGDDSETEVDGGDNGSDDEEKEEEEEEACGGCRVEYEEEEKGIEFDKETFSRLLRRVSLVEAKLYSQISYLGTLAYCIPKIKPENRLKRRGLQFVTSSIEKRNLAMKTEQNQALAREQGEEKISKEEKESKDQKTNRYHFSASAAYEIVASAASYLHSHTKSIIPLRSSKAEASEDSTEGEYGNSENVDMMNPEVASLMATTDSVTAVVAAKEEVKQAVADDLSSTRSSPCEWYICDDDQGTRFFVIQGSESLASWQANLLFEPVQFEGLDVLVHRGIYEAAKGIYAQMLPEVQTHLKSRGRHATFRFTGHSLGGSLSLLINLMLLIRGEVPASSLLPVITFGAPSVMCGGDRLLRKLGLPRSHVQAITMHRDIVPRAFSCNYPNHVTELLKAVNGSFRNHPCLNNQKLLYSPMGELLILQPDEKFSPHHHLLPSGSGLYFLSCPLSDIGDAEKQLRAAQTVFLNSPHPLEILSDRSSYGSDGTIQRDHDMNSYLKSVQNVIRQELNHIRKARREHRRKLWLSLVATHSSSGIAIEGSPEASINMRHNKSNFSGIAQTGRKSLKRFSRLVTSQRMHLLVILLFPARLFLLGAYNMITSV